MTRRTLRFVAYGSSSRVHVGAHMPATSEAFRAHHAVARASSIGATETSGANTPRLKDLSNDGSIPARARTVSGSAQAGSGVTHGRTVFSPALLLAARRPAQVRSLLA